MTPSLPTHTCRRPPPAAPRPSGTANPPLDCPEARALIDAFTDHSRTVEIPPTILALERLFGEHFDQALWSKVLNSLAFNGGDKPQMTANQA